MSWFARWAMRVAVLGGLVGISPVANAQVTIDLGNLNNSGTTTFAIGTWSLVFADRSNQTPATARGCDFSSTNGGTCANTNVVASIFRGTLTLLFKNQTTASPLLQGRNSTETGSRTANFNFQVNTPTSTQKVQSASFAITASNAVSGISATEAIGSTGSINFSASGTTPSPVAQNFVTPDNQFNVSAALSVANNSPAYALNTMTMRFVSNPEPISISVFGVGLAAAGLLRHRLRRRSQAVS